MTWQEWLSVVAVVLAAGALIVAVVLYRRVHAATRHRLAGGSSTSSSGPAHAQDVTGPIAFIINPTKQRAGELRDAALQACASRYLPEPMFFETTAEEPGTAQARAAIEAGASAVVAAGGDGTVRAVAAALISTSTPMGIVPLGTGNLLARNLDLPLTRLDEQLRIALTASARPIDVGWLRVGGPRREEDGVVEGETPQPLAGSDKGHMFLVIAGLGFDAAMVASTDDELKARVGWMAYFVAGAKHLDGRRLRLQIRLDERPAVTVRARSLLVGNCGKLPGGLMLLPDAEIDDGWLDVAAIDTRGGLVGWVQLFGEVVLQGVGLRTELPKIGRIDHVRSRTVRVAADRPVDVQIDGEPLGRAVALEATIDHHALLVRAP